MVIETTSGRKYVPKMMDVALAVSLLNSEREQNYEEKKKDMFLRLTQTIISSIKSQGNLGTISRDSIRCLFIISDANKDDLSRELNFNPYKPESQITLEERDKTAEFLVNGVRATLKEAAFSQHRDKRQDYILNNYFKLAKSPDTINLIIEKTTEFLKGHFSPIFEHDEGKIRKSPKEIALEDEIKRVLLGIREYWQLPDSKKAKLLFTSKKKLIKCKKTFKLDKQGDVVRLDGKPLNLIPRFYYK